MDTCRASATFTFAARLHGFAACHHVNTFHYASQSVHEILDWRLWFPVLLCCNNSETECTCHVCVLRRWWWLYSALGTLVCISWQMGCSAPLLLPVMMSHVPAYQTGHTQLSPHPLLSQSPIRLPSIFISYCTPHVLSLLICPTGKDPPSHKRNMSILTFRRNHHTYVCTWKLWMQLWLHGSFVALSGKARTVPAT